ncbi:MAG TPA: crosslink repair DNA glycosylase YcaQ family protein [Acidimicrobiia bacterium]|nr:crosslink repair DNA glycosylase YcaQ family protein [Acidimicrobiia bacterium]
MNDKPRLVLSRTQILAHRRRASHLDKRLPSGRHSLERAAWAGLQDSMPRAAVLSVYARVEGTRPDVWEDPAFIQLWGPRFSTYVVAARDHAVFSLGRLPDDPAGLRRATDTADRLAAFIGHDKREQNATGKAMGVNANSFRYAGPTGRVLIRWEGANRPLLWIVDPPDVEPADARLELARRHLHIFGPATADSFQQWAGIKPTLARATYDALAGELLPVSTPIGDGWILSEDEPSFLADPEPPSPVRLLPSGDTFYLLQGAERELLVPDANRRPELWTSRVWPGALVVDGEVMGVWRRSGEKLTIEPWASLPADTREAVEAEAESLPLPGLTRAISVRWES